MGVRSCQSRHIECLSATISIISAKEDRIKPLEGELAQRCVIATQQRHGKGVIARNARGGVGQPDKHHCH